VIVDKTAGDAGRAPSDVASCGGRVAGGCGCRRSAAVESRLSAFGHSGLAQLESMMSTSSSGVQTARETADEAASPSSLIELSIVMPCLNEAETLEVCVRKAQGALGRHGIDGEVIVADNGSTDGSQAIATRLGARVVNVAAKGYGNALMGGITSARGRFVIMGDADDSYDFTAIMPFVEKLRAGDDLVMGNRFRGGIKPGAMPPLHRYLGNPVLSAIGRLFFSSPCDDFHCGLRAFRRDAVLKMGLRTTGMEFASELVVKATLFRLRISEVPVTLSPDGRSRPPHLRSWRDGWRHLRFLLLYSPRWLFFYPGMLLIAIGLATGAWLLPGPRKVGAVTFDVHSLLYSAAAVFLGFQSVIFALFAKVFATSEGLIPEDRQLEKLFKFINLERGLIAGVALLALGLGASIYALNDWGARFFGPLDSSRTFRIVIPAVLALILGFQTTLSSFFLSILGLARK
jgi:glycosyltransferase involved in cell wall biosynthesis